MKKLYVIRHAKSSWDNQNLPDIDRPLNDRGERDAPRMAKRLKEKGIHPDLMLSSPANRALSTCKKIAGVLKYEEKHIKTDKKLYHASEDDILEVLKTLNDKSDVVMIFGHNPGMTDFVNSFSNDKSVTDNIPTCGVVAFHIPVTAWNKLAFSMGSLLFFDYPKK